EGAHVIAKGRLRRQETQGLARGLGLEATRVETAEQLADVFKSALRAKGPHLIEVVM
ncbi:MAG: acetolactate synthase large subunit, partial [Alphaproteobacteria bacterium]|nr:acetolactate synthase large subunit [Alphaproteobacteria bacterium]